MKNHFCQNVPLMLRLLGVEYLRSADEKMQSKSIYARVNAILVVEAGGLRKL